MVVEYEKDETTDMFQIGRSSEAPIDFIVTDTIPGRYLRCPESSESYFYPTAM